MTSFNIYPYVYQLIHKETSQIYFGYRSANKHRAEFDLGVYYFTSSKEVKRMGFENFDIVILAEFFDKIDAREFEYCLIESYWGNPLLLNKCLGGKKFIPGCVTEAGILKMKKSKAGKPSPKKGLPGKSPSIESRLKTSNTMKGRKQSPEHTKNATEARNKKGRSHSDETKQILRERAFAQHARKKANSLPLN